MNLKSSSSYPDDEFTNALQNPDSSVEDILSSTFFLSYWVQSDPYLFSFFSKNCDKLIEIGFQLNSESSFSFICLQILSTMESKLRNLFFTKTNLPKFLYDFLFKIDSYSNSSIKNYFYALPNFMVDIFNKVNPIFDTKYFLYLFNHIDNEYISNFIIRLMKFSPIGLAKAIKKVEPEQIIISNIFQNYDLNNQQCLLLKLLIDSKFSGNSCSILLEKMDEIIQNAIQNRNPKTFQFIEFIDNYSVNKFYLSKWKNVHLKIVPYLTTFCEIILNDNSFKFNSVLKSCASLSISIVSTTKMVSCCFFDIVRRLSSLFFVLKTNSFLHNCFIKAFNLLLSLGQITAQFLDDINLFNKILNCYKNRENECNASYFGHLRLISNDITKFVPFSNTIDLEKWNTVVVEQNKIQEDIIDKKFGGFVPLNLNSIKGSIFDLLDPPSFIQTKLILPVSA
ncbi:hypothetical protein M9Y10_000635 [Tritrichomonas musculus]|uniref:Uncharacterized protein n=1 Tax=Tritrichomonas musculus TaxID=1915356 RepID=A0ABR2L4R6_9EUKA